MIKAGTEVHFRDPGVTTERILHHACVDGADEDQRWIATFSAGSPPLEAGQDVLIYFEIKHEFMQQPAHVHALDDTETGKIVIFEPLGDPVSAESRQHYRVSTITAKIAADVGTENGCKVVDISSTGFAAVVEQKLAIGETVSVRIDYDGRHCEGTASVQSTRQKPGGQYRYGFLSVSHKDGGAFQEALNEISLDVQRTQLRRLSGLG